VKIDDGSFAPLKNLPTGSGGIEIKRFDARSNVAFCVECRSPNGQHAPTENDRQDPAAAALSRKPHAVRKITAAS
jgi:hypothetical protein